jgi:hypothetical protein
MVDAHELLSPTRLPFAHAPSVNAENRDLPGIQPGSARITGVNSRHLRPVASAIRAVSRVAMEHSREDLQFWWERAADCTFPPKLEILVGGAE